MMNEKPTGAQIGHSCSRHPTSNYAACLQSHGRRASSERHPTGDRDCNPSFIYGRARSGQHSQLGLQVRGRLNRITKVRQHERRHPRARTAAATLERLVIYYGIPDGLQRYAG